MRIGSTAQYRRPRWRSRSNVAVSATAMTAIVPAWTGSRHDEVHVLGDRADHVERDDRDADRAQLLGRDADVAAHDRAGQDEQPGARQVGDGPDRGRDVLLADERDRVDADPLAAEVVAVGLADRAERDLGDLRAAADDDDPLAEDPVERAGQVDGPDVRRAPRGPRRGRPRSTPSTSSSISATGRRVARRRRADGRRASGSGRRSRRRARRPRRCARAGRRCRSGPRRPAAAAPVGSAAASAERAAAGRAGPEVADRQSRRARCRRSGRAPRTASPRPANASRVAAGSRGREHQRAVGVLGDADDAR